MVAGREMERMSRKQSSGRGEQRQTRARNWSGAAASSAGRFSWGERPAGNSRSREEKVGKIQPRKASKEQPVSCYHLHGSDRKWLEKQGLQTEA